MKCSSTFERYGKDFPEVDDYKYVPFNEIRLHASNLLFLALHRANLFSFLGDSND
jgi:hypothetical protein